MTDLKNQNRDKRYITQKKAAGYVRISLWVKKSLVKHIKELIYSENIKDECKDISK